jgi:hypothetical protein
MMPNHFFFKDLAATDWECLGITEPEFFAMCAWAFGKDWRIWPKLGLKDLWNERHGKTHFMMKGTDSVDESVKRIRDAWKIAVESKDLRPHG